MFSVGIRAEPHAPRDDCRASAPEASGPKGRGRGSRITARLKSCPDELRREIHDAGESKRPCDSGWSLVTALRAGNSSGVSTSAVRHRRYRKSHKIKRRILRYLARLPSAFPHLPPTTYHPLARHSSLVTIPLSPAPCNLFPALKALPSRGRRFPARWCYAGLEGNRPGQDPTTMCSRIPSDCPGDLSCLPPFRPCDR
jgi:hypothetical protein